MRDEKSGWLVAERDPQFLGHKYPGSYLSLLPVGV